MLWRCFLAKRRLHVDFHSRLLGTQQPKWNLRSSIPCRCTYIYFQCQLAKTWVEMSGSSTQWGVFYQACNKVRETSQGNLRSDLSLTLCHLLIMSELTFEVCFYRKISIAFSLYLPRESQTPPTLFLFKGLFQTHGCHSIFSSTPHDWSLFPITVYTASFLSCHIVSTCRIHEKQHKLCITWRG